MRKYSSYYTEVDAGMLEAMRKLSGDVEARKATEVRKETAADTYYEIEREKQAHRQMLREEALKIYKPLRKVAVVLMFILIGCLIAVVGYLVGWMIYQLYLLAPWSLPLIGGSALLIFLMTVLSSGGSERPPNWAIALVEWRLEWHMKRTCKKKEEHDKRVEEREALKIENQLL